MTPRIGITGLTRTVDGQLRTGVNEAYAASVVAAGGLPLILSPVIGGMRAGALTGTLDGLILSGGADVDPARYGAAPHPKLGPVERDRDDFEFAIFAAARERELPVLAICRGIQVVNAALGGTLWQDLPEQRARGVSHNHRGSRTDRVHRIELEAGSVAAAALGTTSCEVNSFHHQGLRDLAPGLRASGTAPDGLVETVEATDGAWLIGVQWHPEAYYEEKNSPDLRLFRTFVAAASVRERLSAAVGGR